MNLSPTSTENVGTLTNRLNSISGTPARAYTYDSAGNTLTFTGETFTFNQRGRMSTATSSSGTTTYVYNALGQMIEKSGNGGTTLLMYDEAGHILGEYSSTGALVQETIWMGDTPVATLRLNGSAGCTTTSAVCIFYVHTDHLGTARKVTRASDNAQMWRWDPDSFGSVPPTGLGAFSYKLRFPGMYALNESGLFYNYYRDYDPQSGRYIESDPIGLQGGINTYAYAQNNPIGLIDLLGLTPEDIRQIACFAQKENPDLPIPNGKDIQVANLPNGLAGETSKWPFQSTFIIDSMYAEVLTPWELVSLYNTIIHESVHLKQPSYQRLFDEPNSEAEAYMVAGNRTVHSIIKKITSGKYKCECQ